MVSQIICFSVFASVVKQTGEMTLTVNFFEILWDGSEIIQESKKIGAGFQPGVCGIFCVNWYIVQVYLMLQII